MAAEPTPASARQRVREWVQVKINGNPEITAPSVTDALMTWLREPAQEDLTYELLSEMLFGLVYGEVLAVVAATRERRVQPFRLSQEKVDDIVQTAEKRSATRWHKLLEHAGDRHILALQMTREDCLLAATERGRLARSNVVYGLLWATIAEELDGTQIVQDKFTPDDLEARFQKLRAVPLDATTAPGVRYRLNSDGKVERVR